jgi:hypothetical protein
MFKCKKCGKDAGKPKDISFIYKGFEFVIFKNGLECIECAEKKHIEYFEEYGKELVELEDDNIRVNWQFYIKNSLKSWRSRITSIVKSLGILSSHPEGNWGIVDDTGIRLNPDGYYFTRKEDVLTFARLEYSGTLYNWHIYHIDKVIWKRQVIEGV